MAGVGPAQLKAKVQRTRTVRPPVNATITSKAQSGNKFIVIVKKSYTAPARLAILLKTDAKFPRAGTLDRFVTPTSGDIRFSRADTPNVEITFDGNDNKFEGNELTIGVTILAEGRAASLNLNDFKLTLTLLQSAGAPVQAGAAADVTLTAVSLSLDISPPRPGPPTPFTPLAQPPDPPPAPAAAIDKWFGGVTINTQDPGNNQRRAQLIVDQVLPTAFSGELVLRQVRISATNTILGLDNRAELFEDETPGARQTPPVAEVAKSNPFEFNTSTILGAAGRRLFVEGRNASTTTRDTGFQLGIKGIGEDGDRVALTVAVAPVITVDSPLVVVRKPHTSPARRVIRIRASTAFTRSGTLTRSAAGPPIRLLDQQQPAAGTEIVVTGAGHTISAADLTKGVRFFAESNAASGTADDYQLTLTLAPGPTPVAASASVTLTAVELTLDVALSRPSPGVAPLRMSANDKINTGRFVQVRDPAFSHERAMIILRPPSPAISLTVVLTALNAQVRAFGIEVPAAGQAPHLSPATFPSDLLTINPGGLELFVEGTAVSAAVRDTGFRLGIQGLEDDCDHITITTVQIDVTNLSTLNAPPLTLVRFGLWDKAYDSSGNIKNGVAETDNFVGADKRKFNWRVRDASKNGNVSLDWKTLSSDKTTDDDAPASQVLTLPETAAASKVFLSRGVMLVTDGIDRDFPTNSGLTAPLDAGLRNAGQSNHRTRKAKIDGFVKGEYSPSGGVRLSVMMPVFNRTPEERRRVKAQVIRYVNLTDPVYSPATDAYINDQFANAQDRWKQIGIQIDRAATVDRQVPAGAIVNHQFPFDPNPNNAREVALLSELIPITPDATLAVIFIDMTGANAFTEIDPVAPITLPNGTVLTMGDRVFVFIQTTLNLNDQTLAHELHHALFNHADGQTDRQFFTLNTRPPQALVFGTSITLPDVRIYRRIQNMFSPDPDNDPGNANIINWARRAYTTRYPAAGGLSPATATTGNKLLQNF